MTLDPSLTKSSETQELTRELLRSMVAGTADLDQISVQEWIQVAFIHAMSRGVIDIDVPLVYGGQRFSIHMCINQIGPGEALDAALIGEQ